MSNTAELKAMTQSPRLTLEQLMTGFIENSEAFRGNNEALRHLIEQVKQGKLTEKEFRARSDALLAQADTLHWRRDQLSQAYKDAMERLRIAIVPRNRER
jgi:hypothetical protein